MAARMNYKARVREFCYGCIHDESEPGTALQQVSACPSVNTCPLWGVRPVTDRRWPGALVDSIVSTLGMSRADVLAWAENPRAVPNLRRISGTARSHASATRSTGRAFSPA